MTEVPNITNRQEYEAFLNDLAKNVGEIEGRRIAVAIAHRAAMRVLPVYLEWIVQHESARYTGFTPIPILRSSLICGVASVWPTPLIVGAASDAIETASDATEFAINESHAFDVFSTILLPFARAARSSLHTLHVVCASYEAFDAIVDAGHAIDDAIGVTEFSYDRFFADICSSALAQEDGPVPLWPMNDQFAKGWESFKTMLTKQDDAADWTFWVRWYEDALAGRLYHAGNEALLTNIALIGSENWDKGPAHIAALIRDIESRHAVSVTPNAENIVLDDAAKLYRAEPVTMLEGAVHNYAAIKLRTALKIIDVDPTANQMLGLMAPERDLLREALTANRPHPRQLYDACLRVLRRVKAKVENGDLPQAGKDADLDDFNAQIDEAQLDLLADPEVRTMAINRAFLRLERATPDDAASLPDAAEGLVPATNKQLGDEFSKDANVAIDPTKSEEDRRQALYRFGSRLLRIYRHARTAGKETVLITAGFAAFCKSIGVTVENAAAVETAFNFFLRLFGI